MSVSVRVAAVISEIQYIQISQISGVQLSRTLVLALFAKRDKAAGYKIVEQLIESEFSRLERSGAFGTNSNG